MKCVKILKGPFAGCFAHLKEEGVPTKALVHRDVVIELWHPGSDHEIVEAPSPEDLGTGPVSLLCRKFLS